MNGINYVSGDIFSSSAEVLVNPVNTVGVMGKGLAKQFKLKYPDTFKKYRQFCLDKKFDTGQLWLSTEGNHKILLFPTKKHWRSPSKIEYIEQGLQKFTNIYSIKNIKSIAFPKLGCGLGDLSWKNQVKPLMEKYLTPLNIDIYVYLDDFEVADNSEQNNSVDKAKVKGEMELDFFGEAK